MHWVRDGCAAGLGCSSVVGVGQGERLRACESRAGMLDASVSTNLLFVSRTSPQTSSASSRSAVVRLRGHSSETYTLTVAQSCSSSLALKQATLQ